MRAVQYRLELAQRAAIAVMLVALAGAGIAYHFEIKIAQVRWRWIAVAITAAFALVLLLSARCRNRQLPILTALVLTAAATGGCAFADNVLLATLLAVGFSSAGYLAIQLFGFVLPMRWQPRIDAVAINATLLIGSLSSAFVVAEILLWILSPSPGSLSGQSPSVGPASVPHPVVEAQSPTPLRPLPDRRGQAVSEGLPTLAEADALLESGILAAARQRANALSLPREWERREVQVAGAYHAAYWQGVLHVYNSDRMRMIGSPPPKSPSSFRVLVLGDSLTYGDGIEERFTYSRQLERLLRRKWRVDIVNAGFDGAQSEDIVRFARRMIPQTQPDLVIYGVCLNDFLPSGVGEYDGSVRLPDFIRAPMRIGPVAELLMSNALIRLGKGQDYFDDILHYIPEYRSRFFRDVAELEQIVRADGLPPVIALVLDQLPEEGGRGQRIASLAEDALAAAGMTVLSTDDYYRRFSGVSSLRVSKWEGHPSEEANAIWALMLEQVVEKDARLTDYTVQEPASAQSR
jgi:lysophospholipase L1-like esterase